MRKTFRVVTPVDHDHKRYEADSSITLDITDDDDPSLPLLAVGAIADPKAAAAADKQ